VPPGDNGFMRFRVLACDYDRTVALKGVLVESSRRALREVAASGRTLVVVTGRTLEELLDVFDDIDLFNLLVLENGAVLYDPKTREEKVLAASVPPELLEGLRRHTIEPLIVGRVVVSTAAENEPALMRVISETGLDLKVAMNRDSIMVLPPHVDKGFGLLAALDELGEVPSHVVAVGDGENDVALLGVAGVAVAVENAVEELKQRADIVLTAPGVEGIRDLCTSLARHDLADLLASPATRGAG
jgi:hydroxymethylpyrimidine pyrophosphatase-like HAD family hydrolase